jgi:hypothetical protein
MAIAKMTFAEFQKVIGDFFTGRFQQIQWLLNQQVYTVQNGVMAFPTLGCITEFQHHFVAEFFGHTPKFQRIKWHRKTKAKNRSVNEYFQQFSKPTSGTCHIQSGTRAFLIMNMTISDAKDSVRAYERLNLQDLIGKTSQLQTVDYGAGTICMEDENNSLFLVDSILLNSRESIVRAKWISLSVAASRDLTIESLRADLEYLNLSRGETQSPLEHRIQLPTGVNLNEIGDTEFRSLYLTPSIRETTIGGYLSLRPEVITQSLGACKFVSELELPWQDINSEKKPIRPDGFILRPDGYWDICDLKTAELLEKALTTGGPSRTKFKEVILEGAAQLAEYADYFNDSANARFAFDLHGIRVRNPTLFLIVGERDNLPNEELTQAARMLNDNYRIIDYDTIAELFAMRSIESRLKSNAQSMSRQVAK